MTTALYCSRADLYRYGLPRGTLGGQGRLVAASTASTDIIELDAHGFETDDEVVFRAVEGGTLSAPLTVATTYYAIRVNEYQFKVSATAGGAAINLTADGVSMMVASTLPIDEVIEYYSRFADAFFPAHAVPFTGTIPVIVRGLVAELAAKKLAQLAGFSSASLAEAERDARTTLQQYAAGLPVRDANATARTNLAIVDTTTTARDWGDDSGCLP